MIARIWVITLSAFPLVVCTTPYVFPLNVDHSWLSLSSLFRNARDASGQILQHYSDVEVRWSTSRPIGDPETSSPPVAVEDAASHSFSRLPLSRGPLQERSDFTANLQPGAPPFEGPSGSALPNSVPGASSVNPQYGGNFCDEGSPSSRCVVNQPLRFPCNYTISGLETVPFAVTQYCACTGPGCRCTAKFAEYLPGWATLSWARLTAEAEQGDSPKSWAAATVDAHLVQGRCGVPPACNRPDLWQKGSCEVICGQFIPCLTRIDVTDFAVDGAITFEVLDGGSQDAAHSCGGVTLRTRLLLEGEYVVRGVLDVKPGGGLLCDCPNCTLTIADYRWINVYDGAAIAAEAVVIRTAALTVAGAIYALSMEVVVGSIAVKSSGQLGTSDRQVQRLRSSARGIVPKEAKRL